jgi:hypothetical protein
MDDRSKRTNVDAQAAIDAARAGQCRDAMKHLYDASPHQQSAEACTSTTSKVAQDFKLATIIVAGACTVNKKPTKKMYGRRGWGAEINAGFGRPKTGRKRPRRTR